MLLINVLLLMTLPLWCNALSKIDHPTSRSLVLEEALAEEIKEYHFHVYFFQDNAKSNKSAEMLYHKIKEMAEIGFFKVVNNNFHPSPWKPHSIGNYEVWCPKEHFSRTYSWFLLNRGRHSVLIHPLTREEMKDHTERAAWMGAPVPLDLSYLGELLPEIPVQYPELGLGYSARS